MVRISTRSLVLWALGAIACSAVDSSPGPAEAGLSPACEAGRTAHSFMLPNINPAAEAPERTTLSDLVAASSTRLVVLTFTSSYCKPCRSELKLLQRLHEQYAGAGLKVIAIGALKSESIDELRMFVARLGVTFPVLFDPLEAEYLRDEYLQGSQTLPGTFLVNSEGRIEECWLEFSQGLEAAIAGRMREVGR